MVNSLVRIFRGWVLFSVIGAQTGDFLTAAAESGLMMWNVHKYKGEILCCCYCKDYKATARFSRKYNCRVKIKKRRGIPFVINHYRFRTGIAVGGAVFFIFIIVSSFFVWDIEVNGNYITPTNDILEAAKELGLKKGAFKYDLDYASIEQDLSGEFGGFAWISINRIGTHIYIEISEMNDKPDIIDLSEPCNVVAKFTGVILEVRPYGGEAVVKEGDAVKEGDLLISGVIEDHLENVFYYHAYGDVLARVEHTAQFVQEFETERTYSTGETNNYSYLNIFGFNIPLFVGDIPEGAKLSEKNYSPLAILGLELPIGLEKSGYDIYSTETVTVDAAGAKRLLEKQAGEWEQENLAGTTILSRQQEFIEESGRVILNVSYTVEQDIAEQKLIQISMVPDSVVPENEDEEP